MIHPRLITESIKSTDVMAEVSRKLYANYKAIDDKIAESINSIEYKGVAGSDAIDIVSATVNTITVEDDTFEVNEHAGKCVMVNYANNDYRFALIKSNTTEVLTLDEDLPAIPSLTIKIYPVYYLTDDMLDLLLSIDASVDRAIIALPKATLINDRHFVHAYVRVAKTIPVANIIICQNGDTINGEKYAELYDVSEGVRLHSHVFNNQTHWDVIQTYNIRRFAAGYWDASVSVPTTEYDHISNNHLLYDLNKRFVSYELNDNIWLRYTSLLTKTFVVSINAILTKTAGAGDCKIALGIMRAGETVMEILDEREAITRFGDTTGTTMVSTQIPVILNYGDELVPIGYAVDGTFTIDAGSNLNILEI
ncbi:hypothetical protein DSECCO2_120050 [anaerobic digester metagenome]